MTADALNCQRAIVEQVVAQGDDYALALKANQGTLFHNAVLLLDDAELQASSSAPVVEADHGRIETRTAIVSTENRLARKTASMAGLRGHRARWRGCVKPLTTPAQKLLTTC